MGKVDNSNFRRFGSYYFRCIIMADEVLFEFLHMEIVTYLTSRKSLIDEKDDAVTVLF